MVSCGSRLDRRRREHGDRQRGERRLIGQRALLRQQRLEVGFATRQLALDPNNLADSGCLAEQCSDALDAGASTGHAAVDVDNRLGDVLLVGGHMDDVALRPEHG